MKKKIKKKVVKKDIIQSKNPKTGRYVKIDRAKGKIVSSKKTPGPYAGIPIARKKRVAKKKK